MEQKELFFLNGLSKELINLFDFNSLKVNNNICSIEIKIDDKYLNNDNIFDDGILIALIDTFSSFAVKYLIPNENFESFLSLKIQMNSFYDIIKDYKKILLNVKLLQHYERNILLGIFVYNSNNKLLKYITHLKRKIKFKFYMFFINIFIII